MAKKAGADELEKLFKEADVDGNGSLSLQEFKALLLKGNRNITDETIKECFVFFDSPTGDKKITLEEFKAGLLKILAIIEEITQLYKKWDADKNNSLSPEEMSKLLDSTNAKMTPAQKQAYIKRADVNGDGKISLEEFLKIFF